MEWKKGEENARVFGVGVPAFQFQSSRLEDGTALLPQIFIFTGYSPKLLVPTSPVKSKESIRQTGRLRPVHLHHVLTKADQQDRFMIYNATGWTEG
jgi:hypothetical protein